MMKSEDRTLLRKTGYPTLQNRTYDSAEKAELCALGDICLVEDGKTGLIYNKSFMEEGVVYDKNYNNEQSLSAVFQSHMYDMATIVRKHLGTEKLIEIGCGKGFFLEMLQAEGFCIRGFDPTYEGSNSSITPKFYSELQVEGVAKGFILRHVLEHIPNPIDFLKDLKKINNQEGLIYIEVPCLDWICKNMAWYDIFYEHVNYFRLNDFSRIFRKTLAKGHCFGNQYIYVIAGLEDLTVPVIDELDRVCFPNDIFLPLRKLKNKHKNPVCIWGAASKGVIYSIFAKKNNVEITCAIDINPSKQGKFLPVSGIPIVSPEYALSSFPVGTHVVVMNPNYTNEVEKLTNGKFKLFNI